MDMSTISLAWAIPVPYPQLAARLEAYVETKAIITTLQACVKASTSPSMSRLPLELIDMIADELKDISYRKKIHKWLTVRKYLENLEQVPNYRLQRGCGFYNIGLWEHREHADTYLSMLTQLVTAKNLGKFAEYKKTFFQDFGVMPSFSAKKFGDNAKDASHYDVSAWLSLPITRIELLSARGPQEASFVVETRIDPQRLSSESSNAHATKFKLAIAALRLSASHTLVTGEFRPGRLHPDCFDEDFGTGYDDKISEDEDVADEPVEDDLGSNLPYYYCDLPDDPKSEEDKTLKDKTRCLDCGADVCQGKYELKEPELMILGYGVLPACTEEHIL